MSGRLDALDIDLLRTMRDHPRVGALELSRLLRVARGTVQARLDRLERAGVITGYGPEIDLEAAGYGFQAFVTLEIAQGALDDVTADLTALPAVLEAYATTGSSDVICRLAASSHEDLQQALLALNRSPCGRPFDQRRRPVGRGAAEGPPTVGERAAGGAPARPGLPGRPVRIARLRLRPAR